MSIFNEDLDRTRLPERDQVAWLMLRNRENLKHIIEITYQTGYIAMAQAARIYGGSPANARREVRQRLVDTGLLGQAEIRGNSYLYMRAAGARVVTAHLNAVGVAGTPEKPDRVLPVAFARVEFWLAQASDGPYKWIPGWYEPLGSNRIQFAPDAPYGINVEGFLASCHFRGGVYCLSIQWNHMAVSVTYLVVDLDRSRSAYRELINRLRANAQVLYREAQIKVIVMAGSLRRRQTLFRMFNNLRMTPPVITDGQGDADRIQVSNWELDRYTTYAFHRS
jgi:hypothetical protein